MLILARIDYNSIFIVAKDDHEMVLLVDPETIIDHDDQWVTRIDLLPKIVETTFVMGGLQIPSFCI